MSRRRRLVLQSIAVALAPLPRIGGAAESRATSSATATEQTLQALLDTLIPADESPSASAAGVDRAVLEYVRQDARYQQLLDDGITWLDAAVRASGARNFRTATEQQRIAIVQQAERARAGSVPRRFFERVRRDAMRLYYAQPAAWPALGYSGPPQPVGFLDFEHPPKRRG